MNPGELQERDAEMYRLAVINRWSQHQIARHFQISQQAVSQHMIRIRESMPQPDLEAIRRESLETHLEAQRRAFELVELAGAPVTAGKDGEKVYDIDGTLVRDYGLRLQALETIRKADIEIRKLFGLDAPQKVEQSGLVRYEVAGVDLDALS